MPAVRGRKRRSEPEQTEETSSDEASQEPPQQRRRTSPPSEDDEPSYADDNGTQGGDADGAQHQMVKKMVRLALACEYQRRPIRRADISEKVLGNTGGRKFKEVFNAAQVELRSVFGMEMVELPAREKVTVAQKRAAQKSQAQSQSKPTVSWILASVLPYRLRDGAILPPPAAPTAEEESKYTAIYTLLVSLILLSGGSLPDAKMTRYLRRLDLEDNTPVASHSKTELLFKRMEREGYVVRVKENTGQGDDDLYWTVGPRGKVEVGEDGVSGLAKAVYGLDGEEEDELERRIGRSLGLGERIPERNGAAPATQKKKRGRPRKDDEAEDEEDQEDEESEDED